VSAAGLQAVSSEVVCCRACPRLVEWRESVARHKRASFAHEDYWGKPVPSFGDPSAALLVVGLAPAAHGGNRTGRIFTGDRSGDWLFASLHRCGFANQARSVRLGDGLRLRNAYIAAAVKCAPPANRPTPAERDTCSRYLVQEMDLLRDLAVVVALGSFAWEATLRAASALGWGAARPRPRFTHGAEARVGRITMIGCYHPSQQNTFTGKLTETMLDEVFMSAGRIAEAARR
jgi:uracil-DNA glycosylase family 4